MFKSRIKTIAQLAKGLISSVLLTLVLMILLAVAAVYLQITDTTILWFNQFIKIASIIFGVGIAVGRGGRHGFVTGMVLAIIYMILGYILYLSLGGNVFNVVTMLGEILVGAAVGGVTGAVFANLSPSKQHKRH